MTKEETKKTKKKNSKKKSSLTKNQILFILIAIIVFIMFEMNFIMIRAAGTKQIDDVHPDAGCSMKYLRKSDILWVIPDFNGEKITKNQTWCEEVSALNKTIGMHGITHSWKEFAGNITKDDIQKGIDLIQECFNKTPEMFKPPHLTMSQKNKELLENEFNLTIKKRFNQITHKIYHCNSSGLFDNEFIDII
jgi:hypothetical protein